MNRSSLEQRLLSIVGSDTFHELHVADRTAESETSGLSLPDEAQCLAIDLLADE